jgi:hypothetical protein
MAKSRSPVVWDYKKVEQLAAQGLTLQQIAAAFGYSERAIYNRKKVDVQLVQSLKKGKAQGIATISNALFQTAVDGNTTAQIFYLKNRDPENWSDRQQLDALVTHELPTQVLIEVTSNPLPQGILIEQEKENTKD